IVYNQLVVIYHANKSIQQQPQVNGNQIPVTTRDSLIIADSVLLKADNDGINAQASVFNSAEVRGTKEVRMINETKKQDIFGKGHFTNLNIDNPNGVDVIQNGGFNINAKLELTRGELRNKADSNFSMRDSTWIVRHTQGSISMEPKLGNTINVRYTGNGAMTTGPELPNDTTKLQIMTVENSGGITLGKSVTVNDSLYVGDMIRTEPDTSNKYILTLTSGKDPVFGGPNAEIDGSIRRTSLRFDSTKIIFNNPYTWALFTDPAAANGATQMTFRVKPRTFPPIINGELKVRRTFTISAMDGSFNPVVNGVNLIVGYGWRHAIDTVKDETLTLRPDFDYLKFQRLNRNVWFELDKSEPPKIDTAGEWAYSRVIEVAILGDFAVGTTGNAGKLLLSARVLLEGPYRFGSMATDLLQKNLIPSTPPDIYPYNMDPNRTVINVPVIPDSVVDYIVLEFRKEKIDPKPYFRTCFVKSNGLVVDLDGKSPVILARGGLNPGQYYVAVRHRNHLSIITEDTVGLYPRDEGTFIDFANTNILFGRTNAVKPIALDTSGSVLWGMIAGDTNADGKIDSNDQLNTWNDRDFEGYLVPDINMSGIINTRDFNFVWNNRGRETLVPK
ncbi:MAG: hypothetical protein WCT77_09765, partial [Bacteroidota bacterium]